MPTLLISVRFHDGRYHGSGDWPPSPARLFQALVAGAARGKDLSDEAVEAFTWLESLAPPCIAAPSTWVGQGFKNFVPNNDLDAVGGDPARIGEIRTAKIVRPRYFDVAVPLRYAWTFEKGADAERHARVICEITCGLYQLGRGVDMAWAQGEVFNEGDTDTRLRPGEGSILWRPDGAAGAALSCPQPGSLASLSVRFKGMHARFTRVGEGKKARLLFAQAPKPVFRSIPYDSPSTFLLFDIRSADGFRPQPLDSIVALTEKIRDLAAGRLTTSGWRRDDPRREACIEKIFIGRGAAESDKVRRIRITPLPSIGHVRTERSLRRVLVAVPPDCPIASGDIAWSFSGLALDVDPLTGELRDEGAELASADDRTMLLHYGIEDAQTARLWRTVTPVALPQSAARRRIDPRRIREEAKGGAERLREEAAAERAVARALHHAGIDMAIETIRVQREPFEAKGQRAESFAVSPRFAKERLWHVELAFAQPIAGPLQIGDGRYLGLGLMAPVRHADGVLTFAIVDGLTDRVEPVELARALRRAVMARVQESAGLRGPLPVYFSGHTPDGASARSGSHQHLAFAFDGVRKKLLIFAPHVLERRDAWKGETDHLRTLMDALQEFRELRAGPAGKLSLSPRHLDTQSDDLFARSVSWKSVTPYRATRHAKLGNAAAALEADLLSECRRANLPLPLIEVTETFTKPGVGLFGHARLEFRVAVAGPILLGRDRHFGGGLFAARE